jgi:hypothetical protein
VTMNNVEDVFFQAGEGLRQGDSLSLVLFNLAVDVSSRMLQKVVSVNLIRGL